MTYLLDDSLPTGFLREDRRLSTQLVTIRSRSVLGPVALTYDLDVDDLRDDVSASVIDNSEIIRVEVRDEDPIVALGLVNAIAAAYLAQIPGLYGTGVVDPVTEELFSTEDELVDVLIRMRELVEPDDLGVVVAARHASLIDRRTEVRNRLGTTGGQQGADTSSLRLELSVINDELIDVLGRIRVTIDVESDDVTQGELLSLA